ncbi:MAG: hypothetical protein HY055_06770 [Magnetospirillum sp.]|nr:hypothetical protein [Magnetospirillum sp.]
MRGLFQESGPSSANSDPFSYEICGLDRVTKLGAGWQTIYGRPRGGALHHTLWELLGEGNIADLYRALVTHVRRNSVRIEFQFRCDDLEFKRTMIMIMEPVGDNAIRFSSRPLSVEPQNVAEYFYRLNQSPMNVDFCEQCGTIKVGKEWLATDRALEVLGLFADDISFKTWPMTCPSCRHHGH